jgi:hypothetical protein
MGQVRIHSRQPGKRSNEAGVQVDVLAVTYSTAEVPPRTVFVPAESATDADVAEAIRQDLAARETERVETLDV